MDKPEMTQAELVAGIRHIFVKTNNDELLAHHRYMDIYKVLARYQGKQVNKRFKTALEKEYPNWRVWFSNSCGTQWYISVWGGDSGYATTNDAVRFFVGYDNDLASYDMATFEKHNNYYATSIPHTVAERTLLLSNPTLLLDIAEKIVQFKKLQKELRAQIEALPDHYDIEKLAGLKE